MELSEAMPLLRESHTAVVGTLTRSGRIQATLVSTSMVDGKLAFTTRPGTVKLRNLRRTGRATVTVIKLDTRRYVTLEGPITIHNWDPNAPDEQLSRLREVYTAMERPPEKWDDFEGTMRAEQRSVIFVSPERVYGSLSVR